MLLNVHSCYSLRYGTIRTDSLPGLMSAYGYTTAVLTDINNSSAVLSFIRSCREKGLNGLAGMEFRNGASLLYIAIARNNDGFEEINRLMSRVNQGIAFLSSRAPAFNHTFVVYPFGTVALGDLRSNESIGIQACQLNKIIFESREHYKRYVIWHPVSFHRPEDYRLHCQLRAIDNNVLISQLQRSQVAGRQEIMVSRDELLQQYREFPEIIVATEHLLEQCSFDFDFSEVKNKKFFCKSEHEDITQLTLLALEGLESRYPGERKGLAKERILREIEIIGQLHFASYFLITNDICRYARSRGYHYVGRGSGANSIVAYCLGITDVCPLRLNLYFERFLNPKRKTPPDFDVDFSWDVRDEIYAYIFKTYDNVALLGAMSTFRSRSVIREFGKIYGLPKAEIDRLVHDPSNMLNKNEVVQTIRSVYGQVEDFPNQRTIHASGILISELPLTYYSALDYPPKGLPVMQFDMYTAEDIAFEKFDILSQRGLGHIKECIALVKENTGQDISVDQPERFFEDPLIAEQLRSAQTVGCFYIESPAMRQLIAKLDCNDYLTLVAASSIVRPGVSSSGMMKAYIERHRNPDKNSIAYLHPLMKQELHETYGIMVYQEDVMKVGHFFGGLDFADADVLRRMMSGKTRNKKQLEEIQMKFFDHCAATGYDPVTSREVWRQMESFAGYSFNKAHSASYAVESYQSLYLKTYFPLEFMVAVLNNYGGFYQRKVYVNEIKKAGARLHLPCVNNSRMTACIKGKDVFLGYDCLLNLERQYAVLIPEERKRNGPFRSLEHFILRTGIPLEQLVVLIRCGAFNCMGYGKKELLWEAHLLLSGHVKKRQEAALFTEETTERPVLPVLETSLIEDIYDELELIGFPVSATMFDLVRTDFRGTVRAKDLKLYEGQMVRMVGDFVCDKQLYTKSGQQMKFGTFFDADGTFFDTVHFPSSLKEYPFRGNGVYLILGKVVSDFGYPGITVEKIAKLPVWNDPRSN